MNPWDWFNLAVLFVAVFFVMVLADNIYRHGNGWAKRFWKAHVVDEFPKIYPPVCFLCNLGSCAGCPKENQYNRF